MLFMISDTHYGHTKIKGRTDLYWIRTKIFWFTVTEYDEPGWGPRRLSYPVKDRWAFDCGYISFILEFWGFRNVRNSH